MDEVERQHRTTPPLFLRRRAAKGPAVGSVPVDVSDEFEDLAPEDRIYRTPEGFHVKVKCIQEPSSTHGEEMVRVSGSIVGRDGKALRRADGKHCVRQDVHANHTHKADAFHDPDVALEISRLLEVQRAVNAERHHQLLQSTRGLVTREQYLSRKAAEVEPADAAEGEG